MKKSLFVILILNVLFILGGCNYVEELVIKSDGTYTAELSNYLNIEDINLASLYSTKPGGKTVVYTEKSFEEAYASTGADEKLKTRVIDGVKYYLDNSEDVTELVAQSPAYSISADEFVLNVNSDNNLDELLEKYSPESLMDNQEELDRLKSDVTVSLRVTMPSEIVFTNGILSDDRKTVTFKYSLTKYKDNYYAYTAGSPNLIKTAGLNGRYTTKSTIWVKTFAKVKSILLNGKSVGHRKITLEKDGVYRLTIKTQAGNKSLKFTRDTAAPDVSGVKNGKSYKGKVTINYSDNGSGIKSALLNGKRIKNGAAVKKTGSYKLVVEDKAGNKTKISFTVK